MSFTVLERRISPGLVRAATRAPMLVNGRAIRSSGMRRLSRRISVDIAALEKIVESSDAIPTIAVAFPYKLAVRASVRIIGETRGS